MKRRALERIFLLGLLALLPACGGGGGGGGGGPIVQPPTPGITFTPASAAGANSLSLQAGAGSVTSIELRVTAQTVSNLYGVAFDLDYPSSALRYVTSTAGDVLATNGVSLLLQVSETTPGHLVAGISRTGNVPGIASATGVVLTIRFDAVAAGTGAIAFTRNRAYDQASIAISGVTWVGGSATVVR